ncbi:MAG: hypothetical protein HOH33_10300 [Verrucomicrobia bacterium]|nr:hypothetical protein [Verrucomicrobiota bacterium]
MELENRLGRPMNELVQKATDRRRRWFGLLYLLVAGIMLVWGTTWLEPYLAVSNGKFLIFWFCCFVVTLMAMLTALLDMWIIRTRARQQRQKAAHQAFEKKSEETKETDSDSPED